MLAPPRAFTTKKEFYAQFKKKSIAHELWLRFLKNKTAVVGLVIFSIIVAVAVAAPLIANYDTVVIKIHIAERLQPPSTRHWLGTAGSSANSAPSSTPATGSSIPTR